MLEQISDDDVWREGQDMTTVSASGNLSGSSFGVAADKSKAAPGGFDSLIARQPKKQGPGVDKGIFSGKPELSSLPFLPEERTNLPDGLPFENGDRADGLPVEFGQRPDGLPFTAERKPDGLPVEPKPDPDGLPFNEAADEDILATQRLAYLLWTSGLQS